VIRSLRRLRCALDDLYERYNRRQFVHPDPLEFLYLYDDPRDREIVAVIAASLAYGRVAQILRSVRDLLERMGPFPYVFLERTSPRDLPEVLTGFRHRWTTGRQVADLLAGIRRVIDRYGSLGRYLSGGLHSEHDTILPALSHLTEQLRPGDGRAGACTDLRVGGGAARDAGSCANRCAHRRNSLLPDVRAGSACKRLHLLLRWLVRRDAVDPGGWDDIPPRLLIVPLDTHMHRLGRALGLCDRRQADGRTALALTAGFRAIQPDDPVRYDFALTRLGIRPELDLAAFVARVWTAGRSCPILKGGVHGRRDRPPTSSYGTLNRGMAHGTDVQSGRSLRDGRADRA
jgi:uncharacterized protein (TIGR02757 family)